MNAWKSEEQLLKALEQATASSRLEGLELTEEETQLLLRHARGEITHEQYIALALEIARRTPLATP
jgi:uncharacterized membrane protein